MRKVFTDEVVAYMRANRELPLKEQVAKLWEVFKIKTSVGTVSAVRQKHGFAYEPHRHTEVFTAEMRLFIKDNRWRYNNKDMAKALNERFGTRITRKQVQTWRHKYGFGYKMFRPEVFQFLKEHKDMPRRALADLVNKTFGTSYTEKQLISNMSWYRISDKGKGRDKKPVGSQRIRVYSRDGKRGQGYIEIKVGEKEWRHKHIIVAEAMAGRKLRKDECVVFLDQDHLNISSDNLMIVPKSIIGIINGMYKMRNGDSEGNAVKIDIAKLKKLVEDKKREAKEKRRK